MFRIKCITKNICYILKMYLKENLYEIQYTYTFFIPNFILIFNFEMYREIHL